MPSETEKKRRFMCLALDMKLGKTPKSRSPKAAEAADSMSEKQLRDFCESKT